MTVLLLLAVSFLASPLWGASITFYSVGGVPGITITDPRPDMFDCIACWMGFPSVGTYTLQDGTVVDLRGYSGIIFGSPGPNLLHPTRVGSHTTFGVPDDNGLVNIVDMFTLRFTTVTHPSGDPMEIVEAYRFNNLPNPDGRCEFPPPFNFCKAVEPGQTYLIQELHWEDGTVDTLQYSYVSTPEPATNWLVGGLLLALAVYRRKA